MAFKYRRLLLLIFISGLAILIFPDKDEPLIVLNGLHGPSLPDLVGLSLMIVTWVICTLEIIKNRKTLVRGFGAATCFMLLIIYLASIAGIITGLNRSNEWLLWISIIPASLINIFFVVSALNATQVK